MKGPTFKKKKKLKEIRKIGGIEISFFNVLTSIDFKPKENFV